MLQSIDIIEDIVEFKKSTYFFRNDGVVEIRIKSGVELELNDALVEFRMLMDRRKYLPLKAMIVPGENSSVTKEVRDFANSTEAKSVICAQAIVVEELAHKITANFIQKFYKTPVKINVFNSRSVALDWLHEQ